MSHARFEPFMFNITNMRYSIVAAVLLLARVVYPQSISGETAQLPSCSLSCLSNAIINVGCSLTDYACQCDSHRSAISSQATPCIVNSCNTTEALNTQKIVQEICSLQDASGSSTGTSPATKSTGSPAATSPTVSGIGSVIGSSIYPATTTTAPSATAQGASTSSSNPAQTSKAAGARLEGAGIMAGAAIVIAFAL
ncbi:hypothetical protein N431DRAFT_554416 [Stipitochalara longipes BDJ]|nr:hypothetical protein N431DRAFT_554416 [Stipitochalara longipes BDJ]